MYKKIYNIFGILGLYTADYNSRFYLREISKLAKMPLRTTQNLVAELEGRRILRSAVSGKNKYFGLNLDNIQAKYYLMQAEIHKTIRFLERYPELKTFAKDLRSDSLVLVFGSFAGLTAKKDSDLDLMVVGKEKPPLHLSPHKIHVIRLEENQFRESKEALIREIDKDHVILSNHSLYVNMRWNKIE